MTEPTDKSDKVTEFDFEDKRILLDPLSEKFLKALNRDLPGEKAFLFQADQDFIYARFTRGAIGLESQQASPDYFCAKAIYEKDVPFIGDRLYIKVFEQSHFNFLRGFFYQTIPQAISLEEPFCNIRILIEYDDGSSNHPTDYFTIKGLYESF